MGIDLTDEIKFIQKERNMENLDQLILNKTLSEVKRILAMHEMEYRCSTIDGVPRMLTCDYNRFRVNLVVEGNIVTSYDIG